jgi:hypothetical protein
VNRAGKILHIIGDKLLNSYTIITVLYVMEIIIIPIQGFYFHNYNNFTIFRNSSYHFFNKTNLYILYPSEYYDLFLYNPTFSLLFAPIAYLPLRVALSAWVAISIIFFYFSIRSLPLSNRSKLFILYFTFLEVIMSMQRFETNLIIAASILFSFVYLEKTRFFKSAFFVNLGFFIKGYGAISGAFYLLKQPAKRKLPPLLIWFFLLMLLPLVHYSPREFLALYQQWYRSLADYHNANVGLSVMGLMSGFFKIPVPSIYWQIAALILAIVTTLRIMMGRTYERIKYPYLAYLMIFVVIFNHTAETATYITAVTGIAIWYATSSKSHLDKALLFLSFLTVLSHSDLCPVRLRYDFFRYYCLTSLVPLIVFFKLQFFLLKAHARTVDHIAPV